MPELINFRMLVKELEDQLDVGFLLINIYERMAIRAQGSKRTSEPFVVSNEQQSIEGNGNLLLAAANLDGGLSGMF